ncbi:MAG: polyphosphate kinase 1 [Pseudomonadales bacterium]|nr:polyphosphate kinase 1 [Pseudomonadales bacterium]
MPSKEIPYIEKELSWLSFNQRVLQEAADQSVPIIERVRFLGIFSNNLDEFFRVRVADVKRRLIIKSESGQAASSKHLLTKIQGKVLQLQEQFDKIYLDVIKGLAKSHIFLISEHQLTDEQGEWLRQYFRNKLLRYVAPIIIKPGADLTKVLKDDLTYLITQMVSQDSTLYAAIEVPTDDTPRFIELPKEKGSQRKNLIMLDNIIRFCADEIFRPFFNYDHCQSYSMKITCDAEYGVTDDIDLSRVEQMSEGLKQRLTAAPVRFVYDREMPESMVGLLKARLGITGLDSIVPGGRYHNFRDFIDFPNVGRGYLVYPKIPALTSSALDSGPNIFSAIRQKDVLLYYPYYRFKYLTDFLRQAALDPLVEEIKISIYRLAKNSRVIKSLIDAVENGKSVTVFIELAARFDEEANIEWAKVLTDANVKVEFGIPSLKGHAKIISVKRREEGGIIHYVHVGTGNFNEKTAKIYTDFSLFTCREDIAGEVLKVFDFMVRGYRDYQFEHLMVSPKNARETIVMLIDNEIKSASMGEDAFIQIKVNNIVDYNIIKKLYEASNAGVKIKIIVRGICSLVPGLNGFSENISVISVVDRFLEHPRAFIFCNGGQARVYISSADWMSRNLDRRVEVGCPIYEESLKRKIIDIFNLQWSDTTKARLIDQEQANQYRLRGNKKKIRSQVQIYEYLKTIEQRERVALTKQRDL